MTTLRYENHQSKKKKEVAISKVGFSVLSRLCTLKTLKNLSVIRLLINCTSVLLSQRCPQTKSDLLLHSCVTVARQTQVDASLSFRGAVYLNKTNCHALKVQRRQIFKSYDTIVIR